MNFESAPEDSTSQKISNYLNALEIATEEGDSPVEESLISCWSSHPSTTEHVKFCGNLSGLSDKAKYSYVTDSELVP
jgi:hypothetical protein